MNEMTLADALTLHQLTLASEGRTLATQRQYAHFQNVFLRYLDSRRIAPTLDALNPTHVREALAWYQDQHDHRRKRGGEVAGMVLVDILKMWANFLEREGLFQQSPLSKVRRVKIAKRLRQPFTQTEIIALWGACKQSTAPLRDEVLFLLLLDTGMRIGEACTLMVNQVRLDERLVVVGGAGKGRRERLVPIGQQSKRDGGRTIRALRAYLERRPESPRGSGRLFLGRDGYPLEAAGGSAIIERLGALAGVPDAGPHKLRHSYATWYLTTFPGDEIGLRRIIGHVSNAVLADYVHLSQTAIAQRAGNVALSETLGLPAAALQPLQALARVDRPTAPPITHPVDRTALIEAVRGDPELRKALLQALLGAA